MGEHDLKHGHGTEVWANGSSFTGQYRAPDNSSYAGQFVDDRMHGSGTYTFADGREYSGQWVNSQIHGVGTMKWPDGRSYVGGYVDDRKEGEGKFPRAAARLWCLHRFPRQFPTWRVGRRAEGMLG